MISSVNDPCSTSRDFPHIMKRKARQSLEALLKDHETAEKRHKSDAAKLLEQYKQNLQTFQADQWATSDLNPREMAQRGWRAIFRDSEAKKSCLECSSCQKKLSPEVSISEDNDQVRLECIRTVRKDLVDCHALTCVYRSIRVDFNELYWNKQQVERDLAELSRSYSVPIRISHSLTPSEQLACGDSNRDHVILASLCWKMTITAWGVAKMHCDFCNRHSTIMQKADFDPVTSHRWFCPLLDAVNKTETIWQRRTNILTAAGSSQEKIDEGGRRMSAVALRMRAAKLIREGISALVNG